MSPENEPWAIVLILGPLLLLAVIVYAWSRNRAAGQDRGGPTLGDVNAVRGSEDARPDIEREAARAEAGEEKR